MVLPASAYRYQFSLNGVVVQPWGPSASYTMIGNTGEAIHTIQVDVTTEPVPATVQAFTTTSFGLYGPATGVAWAPGSPNPPSGQTYPMASPVTFVAVASGGGPAVPGYQYRFLLDGAEVQGWSANASYLMPAATLGGIHTVRVEATTVQVPVPQSTGQVFAETTYVINYPQAGSVAWAVGSPSPASASAGTAVTFTAVGSNVPALPPIAYKYQYKIGGVVVQAWSTNPSYVMPNTTPPGAKEVLVEVSTQNVPVTVEATAQTTYTLGAWPAATGVTLTSSLPSPQPTAPQIVYTAVGSSSIVLPPSAFWYQFRVQDANGWRIVRPWGGSPTWTLLAGSTAGYYNVVVQVRTGTTAGEQARAATVMYYGYDPATSITISTDLTSPQLAGNAVTFTALAGPGPGPYQYQFLVYRNGLFVSQTVYGASNTYVLPGTSVAGSYLIYGRARANSTSLWDVQATRAFVIQ